ncbi:MAG TPA: hypothetical protein VFQ42_04235 [Mycobacterium sp.]|nr:hypothetical protein [Mycobacterium sp.]
MTDDPKPQAIADFEARVRETHRRDGVMAAVSLYQEETRSPGYVATLAHAEAEVERICAVPGTPAAEAQDQELVKLADRLDYEAAICRHRDEGRHMLRIEQIAKELRQFAALSPAPGNESQPEAADAVEEAKRVTCTACGRTFGDHPRMGGSLYCPAPGNEPEQVAFQVGDIVLNKRTGVHFTVDERGIWEPRYYELVERATPVALATSTVDRDELVELIQDVLDKKADAILSEVDDSIELDTGYAATLVTDALTSRGLVRTPGANVAITRTEDGQ